MRSSTRAALIVGAPLLGLAALALAPRQVDLILANPGRQARTVRVSGLPPVVVAPGASARLEVAAGAHVLEVEGDPAARVEARLGRSPVEPRPTWVWSVAPVESGFYLVSRGYGDQEAPLSAEPWTPPGAVFRLPERDGGLGVLAAVDEDFPREVPRLRGETTGTTRKQVWTAARLDRIAPRSAVLIVGNPLGARLRVSVDGREVGVAEPRGSVEVTGLAAGRVQVEALELGPQGQDGRLFRTEVPVELEAYFEPPAVWVWNVGGLTPRYVVLGRPYGLPDGAPPPRLGDFTPGGDVFRLPSGWFPHLDRPFPDTWPRRGVLSMLWTYEHLARERFASEMERTRLDSARLFPGQGAPPAEEPAAPPEEPVPPEEPAPPGAPAGAPTDEDPFPPVAPR